MMKRFTAAMIAVGMVAGAFALPVSAEPETSEGAVISAEAYTGALKKNDKFIYRVRDDGTITVVGSTLPTKRSTKTERSPFLPR